MNRPEPLHAALRRQATYALTAFVGAALALEVLVPGAVLPFFDLVPCACVAAGLLVYDAARRGQVRRGWWGTAATLISALILFAGLFLVASWDGRAGMAAAVVMAIGIASLAFWSE